MNTPQPSNNQAPLTPTVSVQPNRLEASIAPPSPLPLAEFSWRNVLGLVAISLLVNVLTVGIVLGAIFGVSLMVAGNGSGLDGLGFFFIAGLVGALVAIIAQPFITSYFAKRILKVNATKVIFTAWIPAYIGSQLLTRGASDLTGYLTGVAAYILLLFLIFWLGLRLFGRKHLPPSADQDIKNTQ